MMPYCTGGLTECGKVAVFLGPHESPALCDYHLAQLMTRIGEFVNRDKDPLKPKPNANYEIENAEVEGILNDIGQKLGEKMPAGFGFNLLIFSFGENGSMFYISNAQRPDMIAAMKEFIGKQEAES